jgi:hypothetical protein
LARLPQVKLQLMRGNYFMRSFEGTYAVLPFGSGKDGCQGALEPPKLPATLVDAIGDDTSREITAKLADVALEWKHDDAENLGELSGNSGCARLAKRQPRSLVILHQRMEPSMRPPPGMGGFVRGGCCLLNDYAFTMYWCIMVSFAQLRCILRALAYQRTKLCQPGTTLAALNNRHRIAAAARFAGQVRRQFERMFSEIQAACEAVCASAPASGVKDWVEAVRTSCRNLPVPGQA